MLYPGNNLSLKRIGHILLLCSIGFNLFLNDVQSLLIKAGQDMLACAQVLSDPAVSTAKVLEESIVPALKYIENSRAKWIVQKFDIPDSGTVQARIDMAYRQKDALEKYAPLYGKISRLLFILNWGLWISIAYSAYWMVQDIRNKENIGRVRRFNVLVLIGGIGFNILTFQCLSNYFNT